MSPSGDDDYVRVTVGQVGGQVIATPLSRGAGVITSLVRADGIIRIPRFSEGLDAGAEATIHLYRHPGEIDRTIVHIGSHDMTLDLLAQFLAEHWPGMRLSSANVGSLGGLIALKRGEAHFAGSHLLDPIRASTTGTSTSICREGSGADHVGGPRAALIMSKATAKITALDDLARLGHLRQPSARGGTRCCRLRAGKCGIAPEQVGATTVKVHPPGGGSRGRQRYSRLRAGRQPPAPEADFVAVG
jgi:putative molybdopterin biosynthesis protein